MTYTFEQLAPEYTALLARVQLSPGVDIHSLAQRSLKLAPLYRRVEQLTRVPAIWIAATNERESSSRPDRYLGNGQPLNRVTTISPAGRGPFSAFETGAVDALRVLGLTAVPIWTWARALFEWERWNGWGYRMRGIRSTYLYGGTSLQQRGKYVDEHKWDPGVWDTQIGTVALARALVALDATLDFNPVH